MIARVGNQVLYAGVQGRSGRFLHHSLGEVVGQSVLDFVSPEELPAAVISGTILTAVDHRCYGI